MHAELQGSRRAGCTLTVGRHRVIARHGLCLLVLSVVLSVAAKSNASTDELYTVYINTAGVTGQPGAIDFVLTSPRVLQSSATVRQFRHDAEPELGVDASGTVWGDLVNG